jgi:serine/threonine protein phosphatase 1
LILPTCSKENAMPHDPTNSPVVRLPKNIQGRDFVIGDVHGAYDSVWRGLQLSKFDPICDRLISVGDLVDRGIGSSRCLNFLRQPWVFAIRGNHEQMLLDLYSKGAPDEAAIQAICAATRFNNGMGWWKDVALETRLEIIAAFQKLPIVMELDTDRGSVGFVHADVPKGMTWQTFIGKIESGDPHTIGFALGLDDRSRDRLAEARTDGVEGVGRIFVGHTPMQGLKKLGNVFAIDTGAVFGEAGKGGHLTMINPLAKTVELAMPAADIITVVDLRDPAVWPDTPFLAITERVKESESVGWPLVGNDEHEENEASARPVEDVQRIRSRSPTC